VWGVDLTVMLLMIVINSIFAAYELALASVGLARLDTLAREKRHGAAAALRMKGRMEASLAVVQLGITLVGVIAAATGVRELRRRSSRCSAPGECRTGWPRSWPWQRSSCR
jgi:putative hemolysin